MPAYEAYRLAQAERKVLQQQLKARKDAFKRDFPSYAELSKGKPIDPEKGLKDSHPIPKIGSRPPTLTAQEWKAERARRVQEQQQARDRRTAFMESPEYVQAADRYVDYERTVHKAGLNLFDLGRHDRRMRKNGWTPSASMCTDGVSACFAYEKKVWVPVQRAGKRKRRQCVDDDLPPCDDYDPTAPTIAGDALILGVDPGRVQIVCVVCVDADGKTHKWSLSRGQYYCEGGILGLNKERAKRFECLAPAFQTLQADGAALKTHEPEAIIKYIKAYAVFAEDWWKLALRRDETRRYMQRYIGKRKVLDSFFSALWKDAQKIAKGLRVKLAYGSAYSTMAATGRGEVAAPVSGAYKAAQRTFGKDNVAVVPEKNTTKVFWETQQEKRDVYKVPTAAQPGKEKLMHMPRDTKPPIAPLGEQREWVAAYHDRAKKRDNLRKGGEGGVPSHREGQEEVDNEWRTRFPSCRGLRFDPERRMFYDRDAGSARCIAGLRRLQLLGMGRPSVFR
jgi:hypothetical protein